MTNHFAAATLNRTWVETIFYDLKSDFGNHIGVFGLHEEMEETFFPCIRRNLLIGW